MNHGNLEALTPEHVAALAWFHDRTGQDVGWPAPLNGMFLVNKAKGMLRAIALAKTMGV